MVNCMDLDMVQGWLFTRTDFVSGNLSVLDLLIVYHNEIYGVGPIDNRPSTN